MRLQLRHRVRRLLASRRVVEPSASDTIWAVSQLSVPERVLFSAMSEVDRAHVVRVARSVASGVGDPPGVREADGTWMIPAALLHDVGKATSPLGPIGRGVVTVAVWAGARPLFKRYEQHEGLLGRAARYATYPERGAASLEAIGSDPRVVAWAREHHLPPSRWSVPTEAGLVLSRADDEG